MGDAGLLWKTIEKAFASGADAATVQVINRKSFSIEKPKSGEVVLTDDEWRDIFKRSKKRKYEIIPCPLDKASLRLVETLPFSFIKVHGTNILDLDFLEKISNLKKPVILETQGALLGEVDQAISVLKQKINLKNLCVCCGFSNYPTPYNELNLLSVNTMKDVFKTLTGFADHSLDLVGIPSMVLALQIDLLEKHISLNPADKGYDWEVSLSPEKFRRLSRGLKKRRSALGDGRKFPSVLEMSKRDILYKKIISRKKIEKGQIVSKSDLQLKRSKEGISAEWLSVIVGRRVRTRIETNSPILLKDFE